MNCLESDQWIFEGKRSFQRPKEICKKEMVRKEIGRKEVGGCIDSTP